MATLTATTPITSGDVATPAKLNSLVEDATIAFEANDIATASITDLAVTTAKLAADAVTTAKILDAQVTAAKLASDAVTTAKILDANVTAGKLASNAVTTAKITDANVTAAKLASASVTAPKLDGIGKDADAADLGVGTAPVFGCRAWVIFNGTRNAADDGASVSGGTVRILGAGNVSSVVRTGAGEGRFTVNFTTAMAHDKYCALANFNEGNNDTRSDNDGQASCHSHATGSVQVVCAESNDDVAATRVSLAVFC
jgi:hypothetical protein